ncbi:MAG: general secretion pathway protein C [Candidatus Azotimanducaceae bacterium]|jgi:general secretion pathway protein C
MQEIIQQFTLHSQKIATAICVVLVVMMSLSVADTVRFALEISNPQKILPSTASTNTAGDRKIDYKVSDLELFGPLVLNDASAEAVNAPETKLNLELQGVFIADDESNSTAIVAERDKSGELYVIGDKLPGNAVLASVYEDHVLIRRGARMERLMFSDSAFRVAIPANSGSNTRSELSFSDQKKSDLQRIRDRIREKSDAAGTGDARTQNSPRTSTGDAIAKVRERLRNNPVGTLSEAGISAVSEGESKGYLIGNDADGMIKQAGLQPGDVVLSVNGRPVGVATSDTALMDQVMASSRVRVEVQRGTRRFFLTVPVPK